MKKIHVLSLVKSALGQVLSLSFAKALFVMTVALALGGAAGLFILTILTNSVLIGSIYLFTFVLISVVCLQVHWSGKVAHVNGSNITLGRVLRFFATSVLLNIGTMMVILAPLALVLILPPIQENPGTLLLIAGLFIPSVIFAIYFQGRLMIAMPAAALGEKISFTKSWHRTAGNGWRIGLCDVLIGVFFSLLAAGLRSLHGVFIADTDVLWQLGLMVLQGLVVVVSSLTSMGFLTEVYKALEK